MEVKVEEISPVERKLSVVVPSQNVEQQIDEAYRHWGKKAKVKGFRPGKIPRAILKRYYGKEIEEQVSQELFRESLNEALGEVKLQPVMVKAPNSLPPLVEGDSFRYSVELEVAPDFTAQDYLNLKLESSPAPVAEEMVDQRLEDLRQRQANLKPIAEARPVQEKDFVVLKYQGYENGVPIEGGGSENAYLEVGAGKLPAEFENRLVGLNIEEELTFTMDVPADFINPALAGKTVEFQVKLLEIKFLEVPELDDALAKSFSESFESLADLRQAVREDLERQADKEHYEKLRQQALDQIADSNPVEPPPSLVRQEQERLVRQQLNLLQSRGLNISGLDSEGLLDRVKDVAVKQTRVNLILDKIAQQEGLEVNEEDVEAGFQRIASQVGDTPEMVKKFYYQRGLVEDFRTQIRAEKTVEFLIDRADVNPAADVPEAEEKESSS